eukprot:TRINITY_DN3074_c0_g1_i1.p1 TRINITY_DN3074_c0_g1~~TRINITY_DN3074_c0_g1_i1.p1  ORF type:complete len:213 (+),score=61.95 TRINITY_DN3074_c0_g1_i1:102-740(+)
MSDQNPPEEETGEQQPQSQSPYPIEVEYCPECTLPPEFCEYDPNYERCKPWLSKHYSSTLSSDASVVKAQPEEKKENNTNKGQKATNAAKSKASDEDVQVLPGGKIKKKEAPSITITRVQRNKKKYITTVSGLASFGIKVTVASKLFRNKFSCGASQGKGDKDELTIQGDIRDDLVALILKEWKDKVTKDQIYFVENGKKVLASEFEDDDED